jgi:hypothetical protein
VFEDGKCVAGDATTDAAAATAGLAPTSVLPSLLNTKPTAEQVIADVKAHPPPPPHDAPPAGLGCHYNGAQNAVVGEPTILGTSVDGVNAEVLVRVKARCVACPVSPDKVGREGFRTMKLVYTKFDTGWRYRDMGSAD